MQEPTNRGNRTALTVLKVLLGVGLFSMLMCAGLVFFLWGLCKSGKIRLSAAHPPAPVVCVWVEPQALTLRDEFRA